MGRLSGFMNGFKEFTLSSSKREKVMSSMNPKNMSFKKIFGLTALAYFGGSCYFMSNSNEEFSLKLDLSRNVSRFSGWVSQLYIPSSMRSPLFGTFARTYNVIEADMIEPFEAYPTFNAFFTRHVKPRTIDSDPDVVVSPADSKLLTIAEVTGDSNILVKGVNYKMGEFLTGNKNIVMEGDVFKTLKLKGENSKVYQAIFYLNPGDYHRYHSPTSLVVKRSNHIVGYLAPVKESYIATHERVYEGNERVAIFGEWKHGQFTQVYVGATNVGSMTLEFDPELKTNESIDLNFKAFQKSRVREYGRTSDEKNVMKTMSARPDLQEFSPEELQAINEMSQSSVLKAKNSIYEQRENGIHVPKGGEIGRFNLGSTVVVFFETTGKNVEWLVKEGDKVRFGQPVCRVGSTPNTVAQVAPVTVQAKN